MPIVKPRTRRVRRVRHICRLSEPTRNILMDYARFISDSPDYVLNALIDATLAKDRDFLTWRAEQATASPTSAPRTESAGLVRRRNEPTAPTSD
jgi:hypothetical protein